MYCVVSYLTFHFLCMKSLLLSYSGRVPVVSMPYRAPQLPSTQPTSLLWINQSCCFHLISYLLFILRSLSQKILLNLLQSLCHYHMILEQGHVETSRSFMRFSQQRLIFLLFKANPTQQLLFGLIFMPNFKFSTKNMFHVCVGHARMWVHVCVCVCFLAHCCD